MNSLPVAVQPPEEGVATDRVSIPVSLLKRISEAAQVFEEFQNELEDYLLSQDSDFVARMQQARTHHLEGETRSLGDLKQERCIE